MFNNLVDFISKKNNIYLNDSLLDPFTGRCLPQGHCDN
jgi:hypothetical protein